MYTSYDLPKMTVKDWLDTDDQACIDIVERKYIQEIDGEKESFSHFISRVADDNEDYIDLILNRKFIPGGRILAGRGMKKYGQRITYSNCYVLAPPDDNIESIYDTCKKLARTFSYGGGVGIDISKLAPAGAKVNNSAKQSSGAVSFIETFSNVATTIGQAGRRAALMISMDCTHPDVMEFITHKSDLNLTQGANMSVRVSKEFFDAVKNDTNWVLSFTRPETKQTIKKTVKAKDMMHLIAKTNYDYAEPGILYWDNTEEYHLMSEVKKFSHAGTNPCGEQPLPSGGSCLLGAMNLAEYIFTDDTGTKRFNMTAFERDIPIAVRYLNEVLDEGLVLHPLKEQQNTVRKLRQIGLGFMGLGDMFISLGIRYGSQESIELIDRIGSMMIFKAVQASCDLSKELGSFDDCDAEAIIKSKFYQDNIINNKYTFKANTKKLTEDILKYGLRNSQLLTCAPTGTISTIFNISGGIEPLFALEYTRTTKTIYSEGDKTYTVHPKCIDTLITTTGKSIEQIKSDKQAYDYVITARDIPWIDRLSVQAAWQKHIDASISSTINLPESTTVEDIEDIYITAHQMGLKGTTIFRENCKRFPILQDTSKDKEKKKEEKVNKAPTITASRMSEETTLAGYSLKPYTDSHTILTRKDLGESLSGSTYYKKVACGHLYITINRYQGRPVEVFMQSSKSGGCSANTEALGRLASTLLRSGIDPDIIIDTTLGVKCAACSNIKGKGEDIDGLSCADVMARVIRNEWKKCKEEYNKIPVEIKKVDINNINTIDNNPARFSNVEIIKNQSANASSDMRYNFKSFTADQNIDAGYCPECGRRLTYSGGCIVCTACGFSKC